MSTRLTEAQLEEQLEEQCARFRFKPLHYAMWAFPWGEEGTQLDRHSGPRNWQADILKGIDDHLSDPITRFEPLGIAVASGHGVGKSALIGMVTNWGMSTCADCRIVLTSNTEGQLRTKTAPEVLKWHNMSITSHWFHDSSMSIYSNEKDHDKSWRADFIPWSITKPESFAGTHNEGKRIIIVMDEASAIDDIIWEVTEGALTDMNTEIIWIVFGNPTRATGRFRECWRKFSKFWKIRMKVDSREVEGTNKNLFDQWAEQYGIDSDFFKVRVRGEFPDQSAMQFISTSMVDAAKGKHLRDEEYKFAPSIITCDPAWTGDDELVIARRQGLYFEILERIPYNDNDVLIAQKLAAYETQYKAAQVFIDAGYGQGIYSAGKTMGRVWRMVWFSAKAGRTDCVNKRAEMFVLAKEWLEEGGAIPDLDELGEEMMAIEMMATMDGKYKFAPKDAVKALIGRSPNLWDALCLSFAYPVRSDAIISEPVYALHDYDPYDT